MNTLEHKLCKQAGINLTPAQFSGVLEDEVSEFELRELIRLTVQICCEQLKNYEIPVGNSPAGELAADWTLAALREVHNNIQQIFNGE